MIPRYDATLPEGWLTTAWEPVEAELEAALAKLDTASLQDFLLRHPASSDGYNALGIAWAQQENWPAALQAIDAAVGLSQQYHHYIHYTISALHTLRAEWTEDAAIRQEAAQAALFQDHRNPRALALQAGASHLPPYEEALWRDADWPRHIRPPAGRIAEAAWNSGLCLCRDGAPLRALAREAMQAAALGDMPVARETMERAAQAARSWHQHYHRQASIHRLQRGRIYEAMAEPHLAQNEYRQAHDIDPTFETASLAAKGGWNAKASPSGRGLY